MKDGWRKREQIRTLGMTSDCWRKLRLDKRHWGQYRAMDRTKITGYIRVKGQAVNEVTRRLDEGNDVK